MTVGERIKNLRTKLGMSQVDFADRINVSKQTLYKYENNIITNIPSDKIEAAAKLGNVSPSYLMGWDNTARLTNSTKNIDLYCTTREECNLVLAYRELNEKNKKKCSLYTNSLLTNQKMEEELLVDAASARTDITVFEGIDTSDNDIMDDENF